MIAFTIFGEPASKANSRRLVTFGDRLAVVKSKKALGYEEAALRQIPPRFRLRLEGPVRVSIKIFYASERPDLDESVILDVLQDRWSKTKKDENGKVTAPREMVQAGVYRNDRQVRSKRVDWAIDRQNPRAEIVVVPLQAQQQAAPLVVHSDDPFEVMA